jgi:hypothetical protein
VTIFGLLAAASLLLLRLVKSDSQFDNDKAVLLESQESTLCFSLNFRMSCGTLQRSDFAETHFLSPKF